MSGIFDEEKMLQVLGEYIPDGETLLAGIHGNTLQVNKKKSSQFSVYVGITARHLLVVECEEREYLDAYNLIADLRNTVEEDVGACFLLTDIKSCIIKKGMLGSINCSITLKDGGFLKLQFPKLAGLGKGMPHHAEYREKIIACLSALNCEH